MDIGDISVIIALILSIVLHEVAHGYAANWLGDPTARLAGRLSPNPIKHIDPLGSVVVPIGLFFISHGAFIFGWAKPVPYNPYNLKVPWGLPQNAGDAIVAAAGPLTNLLLALIFGVFIRFADIIALPASSVTLFAHIVFLNLLLAIFNSIPIPPLDGSKILQAFLPIRASMKYREWSMWMERRPFVAFAIIFIFINYFSQPFGYLVATVAGYITGL